MKHLYFIRHGQSEANLQRTYAGTLDTPLTDRGRNQAKQAGISARTTPINLIVASPLVRALETAQIVANEIGYPASNIVTNDLFKERSLGSLQGKSWDEYGEDETLFPDIETRAALLTRAQAGLAYLRDLDVETVLLVSHGSFSIALRTAINPDQSYDEPPNAQIIQLI